MCLCVHAKLRVGWGVGFEAQGGSPGVELNKTGNGEAGESGLHVCVFTLVIRHIFNFPWDVWWVPRACVCVCVLLHFHYSAVLQYRGVTGKQVELRTPDRESWCGNVSHATPTHQLISSAHTVFTCQQSGCSMIRDLNWGLNGNHNDRCTIHSYVCIRLEPLKPLGAAYHNPMCFIEADSSLTHSPLWFRPKSCLCSSRLNSHTYLWGSTTGPTSQFKLQQSC